jgi:cytidylate kinase
MSQNEKVKSAPEKEIVVCISGMAGTGKSTLAKKLAKKYKLKYYSGGDALKTLAEDEGYNSSKSGWWESSEGLRFLEKRKENFQFDKTVDDKLLQYAQRGRVLLDSWTMPWLLKKGFKIWLVASVERRAERIAKRDKMPIKEALKVLEEKESKTRGIYKELYGFNLGEDFEPFDLVLDTDSLDAREVFQALCLVMENVVLKGVDQ